VNELAPAKVNLCLFLGPTRADGRHELVTVFESISLADELELTVLDQGPDQVICPGVEGPNLVSAALEALRREGWSGSPVRIQIHKRIPVAAGLGGGSADAAAALRLAGELQVLPDGLAEAIARELGSDVPSQLEPGLSLGTGAGEEVRSLDPLGPHALVIVPQPLQLSTAEVYREADRLVLSRTADELDQCRRAVEAALAEATPPPVVNDLERAAISLAPSVSAALEDVRRAGADQALVCGSGPTVMGVYWGEEVLSRAAEAVGRLSDRYPGALSATPVLASQ
jgi:4-diphosphocytidyl-2-C-methyl-D-erythritol kinase